MYNYYTLVTNASLSQVVHFALITHALDLTCVWFSCFRFCFVSHYILHFREYWYRFESYCIVWSQQSNPILLLFISTNFPSYKETDNCFCIQYLTNQNWLWFEQLVEYNLKLTGGNWQKWKRVFLTCPSHKIYRDEAVGLKSCKNTWKITIFVKMWNLGQYCQNLIFCQ